MDFNELHLRELFSRLFHPDASSQPSESDSTSDSTQSDPRSMMQDNRFPINAPDLIGQQQQQPVNQMDEYAQLQKLFPMQHDASDRLKNTLDTIPQRGDYQPSGMRKFASFMAGMSGQPGARERVLSEPYGRAVSDWALKLKPEQELAQAERGENTNMRIAGNNYLQNERGLKSIEQRQTTADQKNDLGKAKLQEQRDYLEFKKQQDQRKGWLSKSDSTGHVYFENPSTQEIEYAYNPETGEKIMSDKLPEMISLGIKQNNELTKISARENAGERLEGVKQTNRATNIQAGITGRKDLYNDQVANPKPTAASNPNAITTSTKTMMEGARMLLPHIPEVDQQAAGLEKVGLFGPIMSRIRGYAEKIGTTGSAEEVQASLEQFANQIAKDPELNKDAAVGQFATTLGLLASGAGRVHGGARGGGSIEMVRYMKSLLSSDSTYPMFKGRLAALNSYMKGYAEGPKAPETPKSNPTLDKALDNIFGAKK